MKKKAFIFIFAILIPIFSFAEKIPFTYITPGHKTILPIEWNESWFGKSSSYIYDHNIARIACFFSAIAYNTEMIDTNYRLLGINSNNIELHYDVDYSNYLWGNDQCAYSIASKTISSSKGKRSLVIVNIRGTPLNANEWLSNININDSSKTENKIHSGFGKASEVVRTALISYLLRNKIDPTDSFILITGHSRGAAVSNLLAVKLYEDNFFKPENFYVYTFASPNVTTFAEAQDNKYNFIWNIVNAEDIVPTLPFFRNNWHFIKYGQTKTLCNYTNTDQDYFINNTLFEINKLYKSFFDREYCPFYTGPFIPIFITRVVSHYVGNVEKFYNGFSALHSRIVNLMHKIFPEINDEVQSKKKKNKSNMIERIINYYTEGHKDWTEYMVKAFLDMHQVETYLSFLLVTEEENTYSSMNYTLVVIEGAIEAAVYDKNENVYLDIIEGLVGLNNQKIPVAAIPTASKQIIVGLPSNMEFEMFLTDDTVLLSPANVKLEHFNAAGVFQSTTENQKIYINYRKGSKFKIGKDILGKPGVREIKLSNEQRKHYVELAKLKPYYQVRFYPEFSYGSNKNISFGFHYGIPLLYGTTLINYDLSNYNKGVDIIGGFGHKTSLYRRYSLDTELLGKICLLASDAKTQDKASLVPELKLSISRNFIGKSSGFIACAFDFKIKDFNENAFDSNARNYFFSGEKINSNFMVYPTLQFGIRF